MIMKMLFSENYSSTPIMKKIGQGTQKVKKVKKNLNVTLLIRNTLQKVSEVYDEYLLSYSRKSVVLMFPNAL